MVVYIFVVLKYKMEVEIIMPTFGFRLYFEILYFKLYTKNECVCKLFYCGAI